jgi:hypothetical protein
MTQLRPTMRFQDGTVLPANPTWIFADGTVLVATITFRPKPVEGA